ncbi:MAG: MmgE/PrpD family protein [Oscillospiraceae bacterium]|nr:MmgE/PrpD family protein [Oscillospiraceae bacterium]
MENVTTRIADLVYNLSYDMVTEDTLDVVKKFIVDYYAAIAAGYKINDEFNRVIFDILADSGRKSESKIAFYDSRVSPETAAYMNAIYSHGADMDDGNKKAMGHIAAHVLSSVFAVAESRKSSWKEVIVAVLAGYEVFNRVAGAAQPGIVRRGFHSTGVAGTIASAAACAKLMGLDQDQIYNAISLAALQASGLLLITESGQACKPLNPANAARNGIISARIASKGIEGPVDPLESGKGWFHAFSETYNENILVDGLGEKLTINESYVKPYSSCRHTHCGIECAISIREQIIAKYGEFRQENINKVVLNIYQNAITVAGNVIVPRSNDQTKFSLHYSLAVALLKGEFGFKYLKTAAVTDEIVDTIGKIRINVDEAMENTKKGIRGCHVDVIMNDGAVFSKTVYMPKGDAENSFTWDDVKAKLIDCADGVLTRGQCDCLVASIVELELDSRFEFGL